HLSAGNWRRSAQKSRTPFPVCSWRKVTYALFQLKANSDERSDAKSEGTTIVQNAKVATAWANLVFMADASLGVTRRKGPSPRPMNFQTQGSVTPFVLQKNICGLETLQSDPLRQPANVHVQIRSRYRLMLYADAVRLTYCESSAKLVCDPKLPGQEDPAFSRGRKGSSV